jgi:hypothetical protein
MKLIKIAFAALALTFSATAVAENLDDNIGFDASETVAPPRIPAWTLDTKQTIARVQSVGNTAMLEIFAVEYEGKIEPVAALTYPESKFDCSATSGKFYDMKINHLTVSVPRFCRKNNNGTFSTGFTITGKSYFDLSRVIYYSIGRQFKIASHTFGTENYRESYTPVAKLIAR